jgi:hypothetical protein
MPRIPMPARPLPIPVVARGKGFEIRRERPWIKCWPPPGLQIHKGQLPPDADLHVINQLIEIQLVLQKATDCGKGGGKEEGRREIRLHFETLRRDGICQPVESHPHDGG